MRKGFTLVEIITVLAILGISMGMFYSLYLMSTSGFDNQVARMNLWQEANSILTSVAFDIKSCQQLNFSNNTGVPDRYYSITLTAFDGTVTQYDVTAGGEFQITTGGNPPEVLSAFVDRANTFFVDRQRSVQVVIRLEDDVLGRPLDVTTSVEITPRNL